MLLLVTMGTYPTCATTLVNFLVVNKRFLYNAIIGRSTLAALHAVSSIYDLTLKFPTPMGLGMSKETRELPRAATIPT